MFQRSSREKKNCKKYFHLDYQSEMDSFPFIKGGGEGGEGEGEGNYAFGVDSPHCFLRRIC